LTKKGRHNISFKIRVIDVKNVYRVGSWTKRV